jgi:hypothetical protein
MIRRYLGAGSTALVSLDVWSMPWSLDVWPRPRSLDVWP